MLHTDIQPRRIIAEHKPSADPVRSRCFRTLCAAVALSTVLLVSTSCDSQRYLPIVNSVLNTLMQNKGLSEQYVRELKGSLDPANPEYMTNMANYEEARSYNDRYLDSVKAYSRAERIGGAIDTGEERAEESAANFLEAATRSLRPTLDTRGIQFRKAIVIPPNLVSQLRSLPPKLRASIVSEFEPQLRWKSWRTL